MSGHKVGGVGEAKAIQEDGIAVANEAKPQVEQRLGKTFSTWHPISEATQLVNGINHFIKVHIGDNKYLHVRAHKAFTGPVTVAAVQEDKTLEDPIVHFQ